MLVKVSNGVAEVIEQQGCHVLADAEPDQDPLYSDVRCRPSQRVSRHLPAPAAEPVGHVEQRVAGVLALGDAPGNRRDSGVRVAVTEQLERAQLDDLGGKVLTDLVGGLVNAAVALVAEPEEVVVAGDDLPRRPGRN